MATVRATTVRASEKEMEGGRVASRAAKVVRVVTMGGMIEEASIETVSAREVKAIVVSGGEKEEAREARRKVTREVPVWKEGVVKERWEWNENRERRRGRRVRD